jgi:hypothetical protein
MTETYPLRTSPRSVRPWWLGAGLVTALLLTAGCTTWRGEDRAVPAPSTPELRLVAFDSCETAAAQVRAAAADHVGPWGFLTGGVTAMPEVALADPAAAAEAPAAAGDAAAPGAGMRAEPAPAPGVDAGAGSAPGADAPAHSGTNVHEAGVDEPDLVKTDGRRIVTVADGVLRVVDAQRRVQTGAVPLHDNGPEPYRWQPADLLLHGDRVLVLLEDLWHGPAIDRPATEPSLLPMPRPITGAQLLLVDIGADTPRLVGTYAVDGRLVDARAVDSVVRVVVRSAPRLEFPPHDPAAGDDERQEANREVVRTADLESWLPRYQVTADGVTTTGQVDCTALSRPASYSGTSMLTVLTFDLAAGALGNGDPVSVLADGDTVYSNGHSLYVASDQRWQAVPMPEPMPEPLPEPTGGPARERDLEWPEPRTEIYKFDISQPGPPRYVGAGAVDGWLINQYAMNEWNGHLRVATTSGDTFWWRGQEPDSESTVYVLAERGGALVETGSVGGLGYGERIYSVRFAGPIGYVVTFRETDPLYTVDLRNPSAPKVLGELKITGYSSYLHPVGGGYVLGIGQEADLRGVIQGTQLSLFDVSDLTDPRLRATHHVRAGHSEAEFDPHAFLWWPAERIVVVPLTVPFNRVDRGFGDDDSGAAFPVPESGAMVLRLDDAGFSELALITHPADNLRGHSAQIRRSLVIGDVLWTVSTAGLQANHLSTMETVAWIPFR